MTRTILLALALAACATTDAAIPTAPGQGVTWIAYTHADCAGATVNREVTLCVSPSPSDVQEPGDAAADDYVQTWIAACIATQGLIDSPAEGTDCPGPSRCSGSTAPTFEVCQ
jgi:hypothetical protein